MKKLILIFLICSSLAFSRDIIKPKALKYGDTVGVISPANYPPSQAKIMIETLEKMGFNVRLGESFYNQWYNFGGTDKERAEDLNRMFEDKEIKAIFCVRGGYGSIRILDLIDFEAIKKNPKIFVGYSDITTLHLAINKKTGLVTFHGPMSHNYKNLDSITERSFFDTIMKKKETYDMTSYPDSNIDILNKKILNKNSKNIVKGKIIGGNLTLLVASLGTEYEIDTKGKILFIEEISEFTYKVDRMLQQLKLAGKFEDANAVILGSFRKINQEYPEDMTLQEVLKDNFNEYAKPVLNNFSSGHMRPLITIPIGAEAELDLNNLKIKITDGAVK